MQETRVQSLSLEDPLEKELATHSTILAWEIPWMKDPGGLQSMGLQRVQHDLATNNNNGMKKRSMSGASNEELGNVSLERRGI